MNKEDTVQNQNARPLASASETSEPDELSGGLSQEGVRSRKVDAQTYLPALLELVDQGKTVPLVITGNSMSPFMIHERDSILIGPITRPLRKGDMAMFRRRNGQFVMHRICRVDSEGRFYFVGDAQTQIEGPIDREQVRGLITAVRRKGVWIREGDFWWEFFEHVWLYVIPLRRFLCRLYGVWYRLRGR